MHRSLRSALLMITRVGRKTEHITCPSTRRRSRPARRTPNRSVPPDAETEMLISRSRPTPVANSVASAIEFVPLLRRAAEHLALDSHRCALLGPAEAGHYVHGLGTRKRRADHRAAAGNVDQRERMQGRTGRCATAPNQSASPVRPSTNAIASMPDDDDASSGSACLRSTSPCRCVASASAAAVTLKRARRLTPHTTKYVRQTMSQPPRRPSVKPSTAGATPNEITSASESRSPPRTDCRLFCVRATIPVEHVADERQRKQDERHPQIARAAGGHVVEAQEDRDRAAARVADRQRVGGGIRPQHRQMCRRGHTQS